MEPFVPFGALKGVTPTSPQQLHRFASMKFGAVSEKKEKPYLSILFTVLVLFIISSIFGTIAWYFNIDGKYAFLYGFAVTMVLVVFEYLFLIPANNIGYTLFSIFQLSLLVELINWTVFILYIKYVRNEEVTQKSWLALVFIAIGVVIGYM